MDDTLISGKGYLNALEEGLKEGGKSDAVENIWKNIYSEIMKQGQKVIFETSEDLKKFKGLNPEETYGNIISSLLNLHYDDGKIIKKKADPFAELEKIQQLGILPENDNGRTAENSDKEELKDENYEILSGMLDMHKSPKTENLSYEELEKSAKSKENKKENSKKRKINPSQNKEEMQKRIMLENSKGWKLGDSIMLAKKNAEIKK